MKRYIVVGITAAFLATMSAVPAFAHCHGGSHHQSQSYSNACGAYCEDGYLCGENGHYCSDHRNGDTCESGEYCQPVYPRRGHHHG